MLNILLYIDPGTGSMLFTAMIGIVSSLYFLIQQLWVGLKYRSGKAAADKDRKDLVIFGEGGQYWKVFKPVCDELEKRGIDCEYYTMDKNDAVIGMSYDHITIKYIGSDNRAFARLSMMNAHMCLSTTPGLNVYQWKRSKNVEKYIHVYHAVGDGTGYRMFSLSFYDAVLMTGTIQESPIRKLETLRNESPKDLRIVGCTYLDALMEKKEQASPLPKKEITVLLAPSWGNSSIFARFGSEMIKKLIETGYHIIIRPHPQSYKSENELIRKLQDEFPENDQLEWDASHDNFISLNRSDIMITDYSGIMYDYSLIFERPIIYAETNFDIRTYEAAWLEETPWHIRNLPGLGKPLTKESLSDLKGLIDSMLNNSSFSKSINEIKEKVWQERTRAAKNIVDYIEQNLS